MHPRGGVYIHARSIGIGKTAAEPYNEYSEATAINSSALHSSFAFVSKMEKKSVLMMQLELARDLSKSGACGGLIRRVRRSLA